MKLYLPDLGTLGPSGVKMLDEDNWVKGGRNMWKSAGNYTPLARDRSSSLDQ
jgi:hypothetical protein